MCVCYVVYVFYCLCKWLVYGSNNCVFRISFLKVGNVIIMSIGYFNNKNDVKKKKKC